MMTQRNQTPGRRSLRIGLFVAGAAIVGLVVLTIGAYLGAKSSDTINAWLTSSDDTQAVAASDQGAGYWTCGMHPWVILPEPGLCPICHMDLTPLDASKLRGEIVIDPVVVQNIGVRIGQVQKGPLTQSVRTVGTIEFDERAVRDVNTKIAGWIETLHVDAIGEPVAKGDPLFGLYSPELFQAQEEYLLAWRAKQNGGVTGGLNLLDAARTKLKYFDVTDEQIQQLEESGKPAKTMTIYSPHTGIVTDKHATEGMRIEPGMRVFRIADLSTVWVIATVYEHQLPLIEVGQDARMTLPFMPGKEFDGRVAYIYPFLNEQARQARVRIEFANENELLKPGMFATVTLKTPAQDDATLAPREAIITTGDRTIAFVSLGEGRFEPREVSVGLASNGYVQVLNGLEPGEMVVTSGQFLLDSESRMREALAKMVTGEKASEQRPDVQAAETGDATALSEAAQEQLAALLRAYLEVSSILSNDTTNGVAAQADTIRQSINALKDLAPAGDPHYWHSRAEDVNTIAARADAMGKASDIAAARIEFGHLSDALDRIVSSTGVPASLGVEVDRRVCGMAPDVPRDGVWLQAGDTDVRNPYFGSMMLRCNMPAEHRRLPTMASSGNAQTEDAP